MNGVISVPLTRSRHSWLAVCAIVFSVVLLHLAQACQFSRHTSCGAGTCHADGVESSQTAKGTGSIACGAAGLDLDALLPRFRDIDPYYAFLALCSMLPTGAVKPTGACLVLEPPTPAPHRLGVRHPLLRLLAHSSQVLC